MSYLRRLSMRSMGLGPAAAVEGRSILHPPQAAVPPAAAATTTESAAGTADPTAGPDTGTSASRDPSPRQARPERSPAASRPPAAPRPREVIRPDHPPAPVHDDTAAAGGVPAPTSGDSGPPQAAAKRSVAAPPTVRVTPAATTSPHGEGAAPPPVVATAPAEGGVRHVREEQALLPEPATTEVRPAEPIPVEQPPAAFEPDTSSGDEDAPVPDRDEPVALRPPPAVEDVPRISLPLARDDLATRDPDVPAAVDVHIGTIEILADAPSPAQVEPRPPRPGLDAYVRLRTYDWDD